MTVESLTLNIFLFRSGNLNAGSGYGVESIQELINYIDNYVDVNNKTVLVIGKITIF